MKRPSALQREGARKVFRKVPCGSSSHCIMAAGERQAEQRGRGSHRSHLVASILVEHDEKDGHNHDDADHDEGVQHRVEEPLAHGGRVLSEGCVDAEEITRRDSVPAAPGYPHLSDP